MEYQTFRGNRCVDVRLAGSTAHYLWPPKDIDMRIPDQLLNSVGFISHDVPQPKYRGTAFVVGVPSAIDPDASFLHIVTAAHVAEQVEHGSFLLGMNGKDGKRLIARGTAELPWWYHPTEKASVDVAVTFFASGIIDEYRLAWIPDTNFATDETIAQFGIGIGDEVTAIGLFTRFHGSSRHIPIVRTGNIAMMPDDRIPVTGFQPMEAYLAEGRSIGGLSGSPVFVRETINIPVGQSGGTQRFLHGQGKLHFLGLMHGHWDAPLGFVSAEQVEAVNMGISIIVPAKKILEVLYQPELIKMRKEIEEREQAKTLPTADSTFEKPDITREEFEAALKKASRKIDK